VLGKKQLFASVYSLKEKRDKLKKSSISFSNSFLIAYCTDSHPKIFLKTVVISHSKSLLTPGDSRIRTQRSQKHQ
jgi:hypothetical protein